MDIQTTVIELIDNLFMEDISDMMDEDLFDAGVLDSMGTVELVIELESKFNMKFQSLIWGVMTGILAIKLCKARKGFTKCLNDFGSFWSTSRCLCRFIRLTSTCT